MTLILIPKLYCEGGSLLRTFKTLTTALERRPDDKLTLNLVKTNLIDEETKQISSGKFVQKAGSRKNVISLANVTWRRMEESNAIQFRYYFGQS